MVYHNWSNFDFNWLYRPWNGVVDVQKDSHLVYKFNSKTFKQMKNSILNKYLIFATCPEDDGEPSYSNDADSDGATDYRLTIYKSLVDPSKPDEYVMYLGFWSGSDDDEYTIKVGDDKDHKVEVVYTHSDKRYSIILDGICL